MILYVLDEYSLWEAQRKTQLFFDLSVMVAVFLYVFCEYLIEGYSILRHLASLGTALSSLSSCSQNIMTNIEMIYEY
jgi:hypothetical protein